MVPSSLRTLEENYSPVLAFRGIHSVRHAITPLGSREFRRWVAIVTFVTMAESKTPELMGLLPPPMPCLTGP